jgi:hypothetical protein
LFPDEVVQFVNGHVFWRIACLRYSKLRILPMWQRKEGRLTRGDVVVKFEGNLMSKLYEVDSLQNGQTLANRGDTHFL